MTANEYLARRHLQRTVGEDAYDGRLRGRPQRRARAELPASRSSRMGYRIRLAGGRTIDAFLDLFNATNEPNFANPTNDRRADRRRSCRITADASTRSPTRTAQLNLRFGF